MAVLQIDNTNWIFGLVGALILILFIILLVVIKKMMDSRKTQPPKELPGIKEIKKDLEDRRLINLNEPSPKQAYPTDYDPTKDPRVVELVKEIRDEIKTSKKEEELPKPKSFGEELDELIISHPEMGKIDIIKELEAAKFKLVG